MTAFGVQPRNGQLPGIGQTLRPAMNTISGHIAVADYLVDADALCGLEHACDPTLCRHKSCCGVYDIWVGAEDRERLAEHLKDASTLPGGAGRSMDMHDVLRWVGAGYILRKNKDGLCMLAYRAEDGSVLCSLHSAALQRNCPPCRAKPSSCTLWPLSLTGAAGHRIVSIQPGAFEFPCNRRRISRRPLLHLGTATLIRDNFGIGFLSALEAGLKEAADPP